MGNALGGQRRSCQSTFDGRGDDLPGSAELRARTHVGNARNTSCRSYAPSVPLRSGAHPRRTHGRSARGVGVPRSGFDSRGDQASGATRATRVRLRRRALEVSHELALGDVSDKVPDPGDAMATKRTPTKKTTKKTTKKRASKAPTKTATKKRASKAPAKKRTSRVPAKSSRPTKPARPKAKKAAAPESVSVPASVSAPVPVPAPVSASVPVSASAPSSRPPSYLEGVPQDHAELVSGLFQVVRGAAKDLKTLVTQAIAMSHQKNDPFDR